MDIQVSSNFERLLFEMNDRDGVRTAEQLARFRRAGGSTRGRGPPAVDRGRSGRPASTTPTTLAEMRRVHDSTGMLIDPHTATATQPAVCSAASHPS